MKNLRQVSKEQLKKVFGGTGPQANCHCSPSGSGKPAIDIIADNAVDCFNKCEEYRNN
ncbi:MULTISPECIES: bacteriocin-like protein [unclassified Chryseobacterium]|uniref:bacteriocin-like protein n=1 Tax=unclassified Chryseobacterium TaxID=2593645 RepID=UPI001AE36567|nr:MULTISPECIES: hypothetical protein [unclassified Chryseobacterium]MBP1166817.1 hypothetical protein [Chryseobacterium sp. PvR013]MDR4893682.1 hypothetical protein [Chryseobacterium sp. CFS7]